MSYYEKALEVHEEHKGKIEVVSKLKVTNKDELSVAYTPGVAEPCRKIANNQQEVYRYTSKGNLVAVVSDGSAVLGLGNIGAKAAMPVMEGKAVLFKEFAGVDAFPICLDTQDTEELINIIKNLAPTFGGINLEDISAPRCFEIEKRVQELVDIPVFHDDQHGTAIVVSAATINAAKVVNKKLKEMKVVINGAGAAGTAIAKMLLNIGIGNIVVCDKFGALNRNDDKLSPAMKVLAEQTNKDLEEGTLKDVIVGADMFVGVSGPKALTEEMVASMAKDPIVFPMANPEPEIMPELAKKAGAKVIGTGRSDFPNQINNVLAFPGIFKGALSVRASRITEEMKVAAAYALANMIKEEELSEENIIPSAFAKGVADAVALAVANTWNK
ncbi:MAG: NADP-dependent malic enzyme [Aminipila sp.]